MKRRPTNAFASVSIAVCSVLVLLIGLTDPALAQSALVRTIADAVSENGIAIEAGATADDDQIFALHDAAPGIGLVVLADEAEGTSTAFAAAVLAEVTDGRIHTIAVSTPTSFGASSDEYLRGAVNDAAEASARWDDPGQAFGVFIKTLTGTEVDVVDATPGAGTRVEAPTRDTSVNDDDSASEPGAPSSADSGGGISIWPILAVGVIAFLGFSFWSKRKVAKQQQANLEQARSEIKSQLSSIAQMVYDLNDRVTLSDDDDIRGDFATASGEYQSLVEAVDAADDGPELAALTDRADQLRWQMEVIEARLEGREPPPAPVEPRTSDDHLDDHDRIPVEPRRRTRARSATCFFNPRHRSGVVPATVSMEGDDLDVMICRECSRQLRDGEVPETGYVDVGRRRVPAALAPVGYGGLGLALARLPKISVEGLGQPLQLDWESAADQLPAPGRRPRNEALPARRRRTTRSRRRR